MLHHKVLRSYRIIINIHKTKRKHVNTRRAFGGARRGFKMVLFTQAVSRRNIFVGGTYAPPSALPVFF